MDFGLAWRPRTVAAFSPAVEPKAASASFRKGLLLSAAPWMESAPSPSASPKSISGFPPARRLRHAAEFKRMYASGRRLSADGFTAVVQANAAGAPRLGLSIAARMLRLPVHRNRIRRLIRESFRHHQERLPAVDIIVGLRSAPRDADNAQLRKSLEKLWQKINTTCERLSAS